MKNEYPKLIVDCEISKFLKTRSEENTIQPFAPIVTPEEQRLKRYITLPYINDQTEQFSKRLTRLMNSNFPKVDLKVAFRIPKEIGNCFNSKDRPTDVLEQSLVIYQIKCKEFQASYIGKTERILFHRVEEHKGKSDSAIH